MLPTLWQRVYKPQMIADNILSEECIPFVIGSGPSSSGPRIGGSPPEGVYSSRSPESHYLLTLPLEEAGATELSIFLNSDWWNIVYDHSRILYNQEEPWVDMVIHSPSIRDLHNCRESLLTPHPLLFRTIELDRQSDDSGDEPGALLWEHKLGGKPYFVRYKAKFVDAIEEVEKRGYRQLFQIAFPGPKDATIAGTWPFLGGMFYLFFKHDGINYSWYYGWLY